MDDKAPSERMAESGRENGNQPNPDRDAGAPNPDQSDELQQDTGAHVPSGLGSELDRYDAGKRGTPDPAAGPDGVDETELGPGLGFGPDPANQGAGRAPARRGEV